MAIAIGEAEFQTESDGNGPVDASVKAIESQVKSGAEMLLYSVNAITSGSTDTGTWDDIPGGAAVCLGGGTSCSLQSIPAGGQKAIFFDWTIGSGAAGASEYCGYGLQPPGGSCTTTGCPAESIRVHPAGSSVIGASRVHQHDISRAASCTRRLQSR